MYKVFLILRYLRKRRIALFGILSVSLCVGMVVLVISVMGGFLDMVKQYSRGLLSDVIMENQTLQGFPYYQEFIDHLHEQMPDQVAAATPAIYNYGILRIRESGFTKPIQVVGIRFDEYCRVNTFEEGLYYNTNYPGTTSLGSQMRPVAAFDETHNLHLPAEFARAHQEYLRSNPDKVGNAQTNGFGGRDFPGLFSDTIGDPGYAGEEMPGAILGVDLVCDRREDGEYNEYLPLGSELVITVLPMTHSGNISGEGAVPIAMRYADRSRTKVFDIDSISVYMDFDLLQRCLSMERMELPDGRVLPARASQLLISLKPGVDYRQARKQINKLWKEFTASIDAPLSMSDERLMHEVITQTWEERQQPYINAIEKEKVLVTILFGVISLVAVALIGCIFYMIVSSKTRDIGIIKSVGASSSGVAGIFIGFGLAVGVVGSIVGTTGAIIFIRYINEIQDALARFNPNLRVWSPTVYVFDRIPNTVEPVEVAFIVGIALVSSVLGALIPAILAARVWPVDALRYE